jgi:nitrate reductase beta subunit
MPKVWNWQLGREMDYPYEAAFPEWQFAFVFNINRCIACQTCTMACKSTWTFSQGQEHMWWNNVETKPYGGYPQGWDSKLLGLLEAANPKGQVWSGANGPEHAPYGKFDGQTIFESAGRAPGSPAAQRVLGYLPTDEEWSAPNIHEEVATGAIQHAGEYGASAQLPEHKVWFFYMQRLCNHCTYPGCLASCPRKAIYKRPEDGVVLIDQERCRGYRKCVEGCPYKKAMYRPTTRTSEKCVACFPRLEGRDPELSPGGAPLETRCMSACVGKIRLQGLVHMERDGAWTKSPDSPLWFLVRERRVALPLYPQFGTAPNGFYIPPRWVARGYLHQMFGPGVEHALEQYCCPDRELLAVLQLFRAQQQILYRFAIEKGPKVAEIEVTMPDGSRKTQEIWNDTVIGFNQLDQEVVRTTVEEPTFVRAQEHLNSI